MPYNIYPGGATNPEPEGATFQPIRSFREAKNNELEVCPHDGLVLSEVSPPGWEDTVVAMKKNPEITNPWALAWWMKSPKQGYTPHAGNKKEAITRALENIAKEACPKCMERIFGKKIEGHVVGVHNDEIKREGCK